MNWDYDSNGSGGVGGDDGRKLINVRRNNYRIGRKCEIEMNVYGVMGQEIKVDLVILVPMSLHYTDHNAYRLRDAYYRRH